MTASDQRAVLRDLRRTRKQRRLGDTEWFDVAYRVYLFALGGLIAIVLVSDAIGGVIGDDVTTDDLLLHGPSAAGLLVVGIKEGEEFSRYKIPSCIASHAWPAVHALFDYADI